MQGSCTANKKHTDINTNKKKSVFLFGDFKTLRDTLNAIARTSDEIAGIVMVSCPCRAATFAKIQLQDFLGFTAHQSLYYETLPRSLTVVFSAWATLDVTLRFTVEHTLLLPLISIPF